MIRIGDSPWFSGALLTLGVVVAAELVVLAGSGRALWSASRALQRQRATLDGLELRVPAEAMVRQQEEKLARNREVLDGRCARLENRSQTGQIRRTVATRAEAFFEIAAFTGRMRAQAGHAGVELAADETFGFSEFAHTGPAPEQIEAVARQWQTVEALGTALWQAQPAKLIRVRRERVGAGEAVPPTDAATRGRDHVMVETSLSARLAGLIEATAFELEFSGDTAALRNFLGGVAALELPLSVRTVTVTPEAPAAAGSLVRRGLSTFTVMIERVALAESARGKIGKATAPTELLGTGNRPIWRPPVPQSRGSEWIYDVFTPPEICFEGAKQLLAARVPEAAGVFAREGGDPFGLRLLAVRPVMFRVRLVGYAGAGERMRGLFEDTHTGEVMFAGAGEALGKLGWNVERLEVERVAVAADAPGTVQPIAHACLRDRGTGAVIMLTDQAPLLTDEIVATVATDESPAQEREVRPGDEVVCGPVRYRIGKIRLAPPTLEATKVSFDPARTESRTLRDDTVELAEKARPVS